MNDIHATIDEALDSKIVDQGQHEKLVALFRSRNLIEPEPASPTEASGLLASLDTAIDNDVLTQTEASEMPRLVRGFHDVLISIGIIAALAGLWSVAGSIPVIVACVILAEIFVRRQNLALPAFALTIGFVFSVAVTTQIVVDQLLPSMAGEIDAMIVFGVQLIAFFLFYWRFKIPVSLAAFILGGVGFGIAMVLAIIGSITGVDNFQSGYEFRTGMVGFFFAVVLFAIAMKFDSRDLRRVTRNSDVAFWLHLCAAPLLLYSVLGTMFADGFGFTSAQPGTAQIVTVIAIVAFLMLIGIIIDRRAFVTSGLISLGIAIYYLAQQIDLEFSSLGGLALLLVGLIVLTLGTSWQWMRRGLITILPTSIQSRVPPVSA